MSLCLCEGATAARRTTTGKQRATVIKEVTEGDDKTAVATNPTPMVTALLRPRMLVQRAAYSQLQSRRQRLEFLHQNAVIGGAESRVTGERLHVDRLQPLRRLRLRPEPRPAGVMGIRPSDRRRQELVWLARVVPHGTVLVDPPPESPNDDDDVDETLSMSMANVVDNRDRDGVWTPPSRSLQNWTALSYNSTPGLPTSPLNDSPS